MRTEPGLQTLWHFPESARSMRLSEMDRVAVATIGDVLTHDVNMAQNGAGRDKPFDIAVIHGVGAAVVPLSEDELFGPSAEITIVQHDGQLFLSAAHWNRLDWRQRLHTLQAVLAIFTCLPKRPFTELRWSFSGKTVVSDNATGLLDRWMRDRAPLVTDLIDFVIDNHPPVHMLRTCGLAAMFGFELEADIGGLPDSELARMVGRLGQVMLEDGLPSSDKIFGPDKIAYRLRQIANPLDGPPALRISRERT